jgi:16S rRNA (guanine527-N7)-methyltransferase
VNERAKNILACGVAELGVKLTPAELGEFYILAAELKKWSKKINLTAIREDEDVVVKHFLDSLTLLRIISAKGYFLDVGSGGGFPAIPLKIARHELHVVSVDAVEKKIIFQRHVARLLGLQRFEALHARAEELAAMQAGCYDWVVSRAFADIPTFVHIALPLVKENGRIIAMKGRGGNEEAAASMASLLDMGVEVCELVELRLPGSGDFRLLVVMRKILPATVV